MICLSGISRSGVAAQIDPMVACFFTLEGRRGLSQVLFAKMDVASTLNARGNLASKSLGALLWHGKVQVKRAEAITALLGIDRILDASGQLHMP